MERKGGGTSSDGDPLPFLVNQDKTYGRTPCITWESMMAFAELLAKAGALEAARALRCCRRSRRAIPVGHLGLWVCCRRRYCPSCAAARARQHKARVRDRLEEAVARGGAAAFLTLNPAMDPNLDLRDRITKLLAQFSRIRNRRAWRCPERGYQAQVGMIFGLEIGAEHPHGHPHLHILLWGLNPVVAMAAGLWLKQAWCALEPGAQPWLQKLDPVEPSWGSLDRVSAYVTKGSRISTAWPESLILAVVQELSSGRRHLIRCGRALPRGRHQVVEAA